MGRTSVMIACIFLATLLKVSAQDGSSFEFVENKGQWNSAVLFEGKLVSGAFYLQKKGFTVALHNPGDLRSALGHNRLNQKSGGGRPARFNPVIHSHSYTVEFEGANENAAVAPDKALSTYNNYFIGNDSSKWTNHARIFHAVLYKNIYPNIDIRYYSENSTLKYDIIVRPGGDPSKIVLKYTGADKLSVRNNELVIKTSVGEIKELYPYSFQSDNVKGRKKIECKYVVTGNKVRFQVAEYSKDATLIIDPSLIFVSFTGSRADEYGFTATPGPDGSLFSGGIVFSTGYPVTPGAYQTNYMSGTKGTVDIGITKFSPNGSQRLYATYLGGSGDEYPHSLFCDPQGNLVVMGRSYSTNYPGTVVQDNEGGSIIVTKLNNTGSALIGSLIIGGKGLDGVNIEDMQQTAHDENQSLIRNYGDDSRSEVILDGANNIYVAAQTHSTNFPTPNGFQKVSGGQQDGVVMKINPTCTALIWSTYLGGNGDDGAFVLDINPLTNEIFVGGATTTQVSFPGIIPGVANTTYQGGEMDAFVSVFSNNGNLLRSTYLGRGGADVIYGLKFDRKGFPYIMGVSRGGNWPVTTNVIFKVDKSSQFVAKLLPDLSGFVYSTLFGSGSPKPNMSPTAFLVDRCENVYISGWGGWLFTGPDPFDQAGVAGMPISNTGDEVKTKTDNRDFYFIVIQKNASQLLYGTYFGQINGETGEHVDGGTSRYDQQGVIYQAICANCAGGAVFPTTPGVIGPVNGAGGQRAGCNLAAIKMSFDFAGVVAGPKAYFNGIPDSVGCAPFTVNFRDTIVNAVSYDWNFGDGSPDTTTADYNITHTFQNPGTFRVRLIAIDPNSCNERDTAYINIRVGALRASLDMDINKFGPCQDLNYQFTNLTTSNGGTYNDTSFTWDFGDGTRLITGFAPVTHQYAQPGTYMVKLVITDTAYCNAPDYIPYQNGLRVNPLVKAQFETPATGCAPYDAVFTNTSLAGESFEWDFGDGNTSTSDALLVYNTYVNPGTYSIRLVARDPGTCNLVDDTTLTIVVSGKPTAAFSYTPISPVQNKPHIFTNLSTGGVSYKWMFGDGDSTVKNTTDTVLHQYNASGPYNVMLITYNQFGCTDTARDVVVADILPLLDVPNAFTPGKFGRNAVVKVEGFGIAKMSWKIYNRWGQKVFETNDRHSGWDGTYNGKVQPVDVYQYTLDVQYVDGKTTRKMGDITLIR